MPKKTRINKEIKETLKAEVSPLLIGVRNDLKEIDKTLRGSDVAKGVKDKARMNDGYEHFLKLVQSAIITVKGEQGEKGKDAVVDYDLLLKEIKKMIPEAKHGKDGRDGANGKDGKDYVLTEKDIKAIAKKVEPPQITADFILDLLSKEGIPARYIRGIDKLIKKAVSELKPWTVAGGMGTGGTGGEGVAFASETPSGLVNGTNRIYTVSRSISIVLGLAINGQTIHPSEYSYSGQTITMNSAFHSSLSGLPFTIIYVAL